MLRWFLRRQIAAFERTWNYNAPYLHDMIDADPRAMLVFGKVQGLSRYREDIQIAPYCAAGLVAAMAEDCGLCTQLGIDMAQRQGVDPAILRAIVARDYAVMPMRSPGLCASPKRRCGMRRKPMICAKRCCGFGANAA